MALFKILNNIANRTQIGSLADARHVEGYCYFDANTNKFYIDTVTGSAAGMRQLNGTFFGECSTSGPIGTKVVDITGFALVTGVSVFVRFIFANSAEVSDLALNVSGSGAISIKRFGTTNLANKNDIGAGMICQFVYDGTNWIWVGHINTTSSDINVRQSLLDTNTNHPLLLGYSANDVLTNDVDNISYRTNTIYANPSTGTITATNFAGKINGHDVNADVPANAVFTDTTYSAGSAISIDASNHINNSGVRMIAAGDTAGTIKVNINGTYSTITIPGLGGNAYSSTEYAPINSPALTGIPTAPTAANGTSSTQIATTEFVANAMSSLSGPMRFIGTLGENGTATTLAAAAESNKGWTYKVITAGTYQSITAQVGDMFVSTGTSWILVPSGDEPSGTVTNIATGDGLTGGPVTSTGTISHAIPSGAQSATHGNANDYYFVKQITTDKFGHITNITTGNEASTAQRLAHTLTFGAGQAFIFDGSADVTVPVYTGSLV